MSIKLPIPPHCDAYSLEALHAYGRECARIATMATLAPIARLDPPTDGAEAMRILDVQIIAAREAMAKAVQS